jgi:hypothetical protein
MSITGDSGERTPPGGGHGHAGDQGGQGGHRVPTSTAHIRFLRELMISVEFVICSTHSSVLVG